MKCIAVQVLNELNQDSSNSLSSKICQRWTGRMENVKLQRIKSIDISTIDKTIGSVGDKILVEFTYYKKIFLKCEILDNKIIDATDGSSINPKVMQIESTLSQKRDRHS
jgi:predicted component of viral defense system (DUF524 family)